MPWSPLSGGDSDETVSVVGSAPELSVTLTATPNPARAAMRLLYTLNITNATARPVDGIGMLFRVPANLSFNGATDANPAGGCFNNACSPGVEAVGLHAPLILETTSPSLEP